MNAKVSMKLQLVLVVLVLLALFLGAFYCVLMGEKIRIVICSDVRQHVLDFFSSLENSEGKKVDNVLVRN